MCSENITMARSIAPRRSPLPRTKFQRARNRGAMSRHEKYKATKIRWQSWLTPRFAGRHAGARVHGPVRGKKDRASMPRRGFDAQWPAFVPGPLAGPGLAQVGGGQRRPDRRGGFEFGHVQAGGGEESVPIGRRKIWPRADLLFPAGSLQSSEPALGIQLDIDHARHGWLGIVLIDAPRNQHVIRQAERQHGFGALAIPEGQRRRTAASNFVPLRKRLVVFLQPRSESSG
jgi:hypothetical protein